MSPKKKLSGKEIKNIIKEHKTKGKSQRDLADKYEVSKTTVQRLISANVKDRVSDKKSESESILLSFDKFFER